MILGLYAAGTFLLDTKEGSNIFVPLPAAGLALVTAIVSLAAYIWAPKKYTYALALGTYLLMCATIGILISLTGGTESVYLPMWMLLAVFSGLFGFWGIGTVFAATNVTVLYQLLLSGAVYSREQIIIFFLASEMPILVSYLIWHEKNKQDEGKSKAYDAMARELNQVANKSETVINSIAEGVVVTDGDGKIQLINPAAQQLLGWEKQDAIGLDYKSIIKMGDSKGKELPESASPIRQMFITNQSISTNDYSVTTHSGKKVLISLLVSPVGDASAGAIIVFRDITEEKQEERAKAEFISTASHEMRTPVAAIEGYLGLALNPSTAVIDDKARMFLEKAHESTQHLGRLFQDLLTVSRSEDGRLAPKPTVVDIITFTKEIVDSLMPKAQSKGLFLVFKPNNGGNATEGDKTVSPVFYSYVDQDQLREVLNNLVDNAIKYTKQGNVTIDVTGDDSNITVSVTDTGIGVPPEDVPHLFQKFYRVDNSDTREIGGTGLGLYISRRLIESNNGHIGVNSDYGKGSTFFVTLPRISHDRANELIADQAQQATHLPAHAPAAPIPGGTPIAPAQAPQAIANQTTTPQLGIPTSTPSNHAPAA